MRTYMPRPSAADLRRMRVLVNQIQSRRAGDLQTAELVAVARRIGPSFAFTIDFDAVKELGFPLLVIRGVTRPRRARAVFAPLSPRERQVAILMASGLRNREVAEQLSISLATVKDHVHHILQKSGCGSRAQFIAAAAKTH
jgi:DNA-binding NarL/FixJ family response regulator